jgi:SAM-dependent methyltransferase
VRSFRRIHIDDVLTAHRGLMAGEVLDVGGKRANKRGRFRPPEQGVARWRYLNIDASTEPDLLCPADAIPVGDATVDTVLLCEVLEHLADPDAVLREIARVLRPGGRLLITVPFLYPVHGDPDDFQRWTADKLRAALGAAGLRVDRLEPMGSAAAVLFDVAWVAWNAYASRLPPRRYTLAILPFRALQPLVARIDARLDRVRDRITTGFFVVAGR